MKLLVEAECTEIGAEIYCTFIDRFVHGKRASAWNIKFYVAGVVDVPRMRIDRCIKQPSKPISSGTNAPKRAGNATHNVCLGFWQLFMIISRPQTSFNHQLTGVPRRVCLCHFPETCSVLHDNAARLSIEFMFVLLHHSTSFSALHKNYYQLLSRYYQASEFIKLFIFSGT
jgi:hypothetical protein